MGDQGLQETKSANTQKILFDSFPNNKKYCTFTIREYNYESFSFIFFEAFKLFLR